MSRSTYDRSDAVLAHKELVEYWTEQVRLRGLSVDRLNRLAAKAEWERDIARSTLHELLIKPKVDQ